MNSAEIVTQVKEMDWVVEMDTGKNMRILIASANPLFARGLENIINHKYATPPREIHLVKSMTEIQVEMESWLPEIVIVDSDDQNISQSEFLMNFVSGSAPMQVLLVSLQDSGAYVVYDRKILTFAEVEHWLGLPCR